MSTPSWQACLRGSRALDDMRDTIERFRPMFLAPLDTIWEWGRKKVIELGDSSTTLTWRHIRGERGGGYTATLHFVTADDRQIGIPGTGGWSLAREDVKEVWAHLPRFLELLCEKFPEIRREAEFYAEQFPR